MAIEKQSCYNEEHDSKMDEMCQLRGMSVSGRAEKAMASERYERGETSRTFSLVYFVRLGSLHEAKTKNGQNSFSMSGKIGRAHV